MTKLTHHTAAHLFNESLYDSKDLPANVNITPCNNIIFFTNNQAQLPDSEKVFLQNILKAVGLDLAEVVLINVLHDSVTWFAQVKQVYQAKNMIGFGITRQQIGLSVDLKGYQVTTVAGTQLLVGHDLSRIAEDKQKKMQLWNALKVMFGK